MKSWELQAHARHIVDFLRRWNHMGRPDPSTEHGYRLATPQVPWPPRVFLQVINGQLMRQREIPRGFPRQRGQWEPMGNPDHCELVYREVAEMDLDGVNMAPDTSPEEWWLNSPMPGEIRCEACGKLGPVTSSGLCHGCKTEGEV